MNNREVLRAFWEHAGPDRRNFIFCFLLTGATLFTEWARPILMKIALDHLEASQVDELRNTALLFLGVAVGDYLFRAFFTYSFSMAVLRSINRIRYALFQHVLRMKMAFFDKEPVGRLLTRTINDCETLGETLRTGAATIVVDILAVFVVLGVMIQLDLELSLVMMAMTPITWLAVRWCGARLRSKFLEVRAALAESNGFMAEGIMGATILQLFRKQQESTREYQEINKIYRKATITSNVYDALLSAMIDGLAAFTTAFVLMVAFQVKFGIMEIGVLVVYMSLVERVFVPIRDFSGKFAVIQQSLAAMQRIFELLYSSNHMDSGDKRLTGDRLSIQFENVDFRYSEEGPKVLEDINFQVEPGQVIALVGQTGSGKSTIGKLLTRAYDGYQGSITMGGIELGELNIHSLRSNVAVVHQDVELFPGSIRDNISMFDDSISEEKILWAIRLVKADHMIDQLPNGIYFRVQESGANLSAGQMQLIIFARALVHDAPIVLMDEATASVDSVTEAWIQQAIQEIFKHKTVLIVAHRLSTIAASDLILVLGNGKIMERGNHQQLIAMEDGYYANLIKASQLSHSLV